MIADIEQLPFLTSVRRANLGIKQSQPGAAAASLVVRSLDLPGRRLPARSTSNAIPVQFSETRFTPRIISRPQPH